MTENFYRIGRTNVDHSTFGGEITLYDFEGHRTLANMADKILQDWSFDRQCYRNAELRENAKKYKKEVLHNG